MADAKYNKTIVFLRWKDAVHSMSESSMSDLGELAILDEVGFLVKESADTLTIATESQDDALAVRFWLTIPKNGIIEQHRTDVDKAFRLTKPRIRKPKKAKVIPSASTEVPLA